MIPAYSGRNPEKVSREDAKYWIPAFAGMTKQREPYGMPAKEDDRQFIFHRVKGKELLMKHCLENQAEIIK